MCVYIYIYIHTYTDNKHNTLGLPLSKPATMRMNLGQTAMSPKSQV